MFDLLQIDMMKLIPAGQVEGMVRTAGPGILKLVMRSAAMQYQLLPGERMVFMFAEHVDAAGEPTVLLFPMALPANLDLNAARKFPYRDLLKDMAVAPIAEWVRQLKGADKQLDAFGKLVTKWQAAASAGKKEDSAKLWAEVQKLKAAMPPLVRTMLAQAQEPAKAETVAGLPPAEETPLRLNTAPTGAAATGGSPADEPNNEQPATDNARTHD